MATFEFLGPVLVIIALIVLFLGFKILKSAVKLFINSIIGIILLWLINLLPIIQVDINIWSVLIVVILGIPGLILVVILSLLGIAF